MQYIDIIKKLRVFLNVTAPLESTCLIPTVSVSQREGVWLDSTCQRYQGESLNFDEDKIPLFTL